MKKFSLFVLSAMIPLTSMGAPRVIFSHQENNFAIPSQFSITGVTKTLEWGCPIDNEELVETESKKSAMNRLVSECLNQASRAAQSKPEVAAVIQTSLIAPDLAFREIGQGKHVVNGTIFLRTVVAMVKSPK